LRGQDRAVSFLRSAARNRRIGHAYIFHGPAGVGKSLAAANFAKAVNCAAADENVRPCDSCPSCRKADAGSHPDISVIRPAKGAASVGIDAIRALIKDIGLKPYEGRKKFYIVEDAQTMKEEASNAVLKTLEEPPSDSVIILIARRADALLPTIVSRSQAVKFFPLGPDEVKGVLVERFAMDPERAHIASHLTAGSVGEALRYGDDAFFARRSRIMDGLVDGTIFDSDFEKMNRQDLGDVLSVMLTWYRDLLVAKAYGPPGCAIINVDRADAITRSSSMAGYDTLQNAIARILSTFAALEMNANPKLAMAALGAEVG
jgi:DNA polymerase-3 subunit delta'